MGEGGRRGIKNTRAEVQHTRICTYEIDVRHATIGYVYKEDLNPSFYPTYVRTISYC